MPDPAAIQSNSIEGRDRNAAAPEPSLAKTIGRCVAGWIVGYLISAVSSVLLFTVSRVSPHQPATTAVIWITAIFGIFFAALGAIVGASFSRKNAIGIGASIALTIGIAALWSWSATPTDAHWTHLIAIFLMAPAAQFGALFRRVDY